MKHFMKWSLLLILSGALLGTSLVFANNDQRQMVLVSGSALPKFTPAELRRLYLGATVIKQGKRFIPLRNQSDSLLYEVFLQKVVSMSSNRYERHLVKRVYRGAGSSPRVIENSGQVVELLLLRKNTVSFMWESDAKDETGINIIQSLW